jgi:hypothetical protein
MSAVIDALDRAQLDLLTHLAARAGEVVEGSDLASLAGLDGQRALTWALAGIAERFAAKGLRRPWTETQRGYQLPPEAAALIGEAGQHGVDPTASPATP